MSKLTDESLFERFRSHGDTQSLADLFDRTAGELLRVAVHLTGNLGEAEDLVQETFLTAIESARRYRPRARIRGWLIGILQNRARRLHKRRRVESLGEAEVPLVDEGSVERDEIRERVHEAILVLEEPYRTVLGLSVKHGFSSEEIAEALQRPVNTVRSQLTRAKDQLAQRLPREWATPAVFAFSLDGLGRIRAIVLAQAAATSTSGVSLISFGLVSVVSAALIFVVAALSIWMTWSAERLPPREELVEITAPENILDRDVAIETLARLTRSSDEIRSTDPLRPSVRVRVLEREGLEPVAGAVVSFMKPGWSALNLSRAKWLESFYLARHDPEELQALYGDTRISGADGAVDLPWGAHWGELSARKGELYGERWEASHGVILVEPERDLQVQVRDTNGNAVPGYLVTLGPDLLRTQWPLREIYTQARTNNAGLAIFPHARTLATRLRAQGLSRLFVLDRSWSQVLELPIEPWSQGVIDLVVPAHATLLVEVVDPDGAPWSSPPGHAIEAILRLEGLDRLIEADVANGEARLEFVPLGREGELCVSTGDSEVRVELPALEAQATEDRVRVVLGEASAFYTGRALLDDGSPLAFATIGIGIDVGSTNMRIQTDAQGRLRCFNDFLDPSSDGFWDLRFHVLDIELHPCGEEAHARINKLQAQLRVPIDHAGAVRDLGDITFTAAPRLARIHCDLAAPRLASGLQRLRFQLQVSYPDDVDGAAHWMSFEDYAIEWVDAQTFEIFASEQGARFRISSTDTRGYGAPCLAFAPLEFEPGAAELELPIRFGGGLDLVEFVATHPTPLRFDLEALDGQWPEHDARSLLDVAPWTYRDEWIDGRRRFTHLSDSLWPGRYRIVIRAQGLVNPLRIFDAIEIVDGERCELFGSEPLNLRERFESMVIAVRDARDRTLIEAPVLWLRAEDGRTAQVEGHDKRLKMLVEAGSEGLFFTPGYRYTSWTPKLGSQVELEPAFLVQVELRSAGEVLATSVAEELELRVSLLDDPVLKQWMDQPACKAALEDRLLRRKDQVFSFSCHAPGTYHLRVAKKGTTGSWETTIVAPAGSTTVRIALDLPESF